MLTNAFALTFTPTGNLELSVYRNCMSLDCGSKQGHGGNSCRHEENLQTAHRWEIINCMEDFNTSQGENAIRKNQDSN